MNDTAVKVEQLFFTYEDGTEALKGVDLEIRRGERIAVMGSNGSGKSTLFLHLNGVLKPKHGQVFICGAPIDYSRKGLLDVRRKVGIVFQDPDSQLFSANVTQEISFGPFNLGLPEEQVRKMVDQVIEEMEITPFRDKPTHFLSGGQKKRVSIADILVMDPEIILLDEPASSLDPKHARMIDGMIDDLSARGITVILSTHDVERALIWADRIILLHDGRVIGEGTPEEIFSQEELLAKTNLEKPAILSLYETLKDLELLEQNGPAPHTVSELTAQIRQSHTKSHAQSHT